MDLRGSMTLGLALECMHIYQMEDSFLRILLCLPIAESVFRDFCGGRADIPLKYGVTNEDLHPQHRWIL